MLPALIERLEKAEEGSRQLDSLIAAEVGIAGWTPKRWAEVIQEWPGAAILEAPRYTSRLDAKLPNENIVSVMHGGGKPGWSALHDFTDERGLIEGVHATSEAIARRIAALKARA